MDARIWLCLWLLVCAFLAVFILRCGGLCTTVVRSGQRKEACFASPRDQERVSGEGGEVNVGGRGPTR